jgi:hypothetical protein
MPLWDFKCERCEHIVFDVASHKHDPDAVAPNHCDNPMEVLYSPPKPKIFQPFTTRNIHPDGQEITVISQRQLSSLENQYGIRQIDDPYLVARGSGFDREMPTKQRYTKGHFFDMRKAG